MPKKPQLGDEVTFKRIGPPGMGVVIGISMAGVWEKYFASNRNLSFWDEYYPEWRAGYVALVLFKEPQKPYTFEEFKIVLPDADEIPEHELKVLYKYNVQYAKIVTYPIDDLEVME